VFALEKLEILDIRTNKTKGISFSSYFCSALNDEQMTTTRKTKRLNRKELAIWKTELSEYGAKTEVFRHTGVSVQTTRNILKNGRGLVENVEAIQKYFAALNLEALPEVQTTSLLNNRNAAA
jgi:hypothetical protein